MALERIVPVHTAVAGRARLRVDGLRRCEVTKARVERALAAAPGIERVEANPWTGNVLVLYAPEIGLGTVMDRIAAVLDPPFDGAAPTRAVNDHGFAATTRSAGAAPPRNGQVSARVAGAGDADRDWHVRDARDAIAAFGTSKLHGLASSEVEARLARHGPNALEAPAGRPALGMLVAQLTTLPVALLGASAALSVATGGVVDALAILAVVGINAVIGLVTERHAERTIASLETTGHPTAHVLRDGRRFDVPAERVVPGDMLALTAGGFVPADARVVAARELMIDEAVLTGESLSVCKTSKRLARADLPLGDRTNMVYKGTAVTGGEGLAVAVGTGADTEIGRVQALVGAAERPETPMQRQLHRMGTQLVSICSAICGLVFALGLLRGYGFLPMLRTSVSLAVAALPEGLPVLATSTLALGIGAMRRHKVQIRHLDAVETLGSVQVLCFDKTGTLTTNRMSVVEVTSGERTFHVRDGRLTNDGTPVGFGAHRDLARLVELGVLCNETELEGEDGDVTLQGSPTEAALVQLALDNDVDVAALRARHPVIGVHHRAERRQFVSTVHGRDGTRGLVAVKGSPGAVLPLCRSYLADGDERPLTDELRARFAHDNSRMAGRALRVLGFAFAEADDEPTALDRGLTWVGLAGLADPVRSGMPELMTRLHRAGTRTVMITGDQSATAFAIAKELNLSEGRDIEILDSERLDRLDLDMLRVLAGRAHVFARVSPAHKLRIVQALQRAGRVVAMTGDGINDSPALKAADIGVAMGTGGTELAREVADVVLEDDDLRTMVAAIAQGRTIYGNIQKSIHYLLATNMTEILITLVVTAAGRPQPLSAVQLLWINLITDVLPAVGLALEPPEPDLLERPPRDPEVPILSAADFRRMGQEAALIGGGALAAYGYASLRHGAASPRVSTITLASLLGGQLLHAITSRSPEHGPLTRAKLPPNRYLTLGLGASFGAQVLAALFPPLRKVLGVVPIGPLDGLVALAGGAIPFLVNEVIKIGRERKPEAGDAVGAASIDKTTPASGGA